MLGLSLLMNLRRNSLSFAAFLVAVVEMCAGEHVLVRLGLLSQLSAVVGVSESHGHVVFQLHFELAQFLINKSSVWGAADHSASLVSFIRIG